MSSLNYHEERTAHGASHEWPDKHDVCTLVIEAAKLMLKCAGFLEDRNAATRSDGIHYRTYYAVDVDTIMLYLQPDRTWMYMDIFGEGEKSDTPLALTFLAGNFLFKSCEPLVPGHEKQKSRFLIVPPHDRELLGILEAMHCDVMDSIDRVEPDQFKELTEAFVRYEKDGRDDDSLLATLQERFSDLVALFDPYEGPKAGLTRMASLDPTTFRRVDAYHEGDFAFECLDPINKDEDRRKANAMIEDWEKRLRKHRRPEQPPYALRNDAEVLASIEHINANLRREGKRLVLITGSRYVFQAARGYRPSEYGQTFDEMYLRDPQAFLAHDKFFPDPDTFMLVDWLNLLFPDAFRPTNILQGQVDRGFLRNLIDRDYASTDQVIDSLERSGRDIRQILQKWQRQLTERSNVLYANGLQCADDRGATALARELRKLRETDWSIESLRKLLLEEALRSTSRLYSLTVWIGLWSKSPTMTIEGIPPLRFDEDYRVLMAYCEKVIDLQRKHKQIPPADLENLLKRYSSDVKRVDPSLYHVHVIHALAFSAKGHWHAALTLAKTAMSICDRLPHEERGVLAGREAAYLACIAVRRFASSRYWLRQAEEYLDQAYEREGEGVPEDIRFASERLTIRTRFHYYDVFCANPPPNIKRIGILTGALCRLIDESCDEPDTNIRFWVQRTTCTNLFTLLIIARDRRWDQCAFRHVEVKRYLDVFKDTLAQYRRECKRDDVPHSSLVCDASTAVWDPDSKERLIARRRAIKTIDKWDDPFARPYSKPRLEMLRRVLSSSKNPPVTGSG